MAMTWSVRRWLAVGMGGMVVLLALVGVLGIRGIQEAVRSKDRVIQVEAQVLADAQEGRYAIEHKVASSRAFLLTGEERFVTSLRESRDLFRAVIERLKRSVDTDQGRRLLERVIETEAAHQTAMEEVMEMRRRGESMMALAAAFDEKVKPLRDALDLLSGDFTTYQRERLESMRQASTDDAVTTVVEVGVALSLVVLLALVFAVLMTRMLSRRIGGAVQHVQSSAAELQATSNQQATVAREQATSMTEISTTVRELLASSRQIAESAQRVARIAEETASSARTGDHALQSSQEAVGAVKRQVDQIVSHMLDLGRKSQQIGGILDLINEHAEQTNILAINASIEAAGAGEAGQRFGVVADEIRRLADRVGGSAKEIRTLVEEIRAAVNTTILATETGSKSAEAGARQFDDLAQVFGHIVGQVATTTDAAREIELSTKQQTTAVEQVNTAMTDMARASTEVEGGARQVLETASLLAALSRDLAALTRGKLAG